jgi:predicted metal-binding membrane protein
LTTSATRTDTPATLVEVALRHHRWALLVLLVAIPIVCWAWIVVMARDMYGPMTGASAWMMSTEWDAPRLLLLWAMWAVMMAAMMLPSATPVLLLYGGAARRRDGAAGAQRIYALAFGYVTAWALFSVAATVLQRVLAEQWVLSPMMEMTTSRASAAFLAIVGIYQLTPLKRACLGVCQSPLGFLMRRWHAGAAGAFRMGIEHGGYCVGCCWGLMLLLFVGGVMNLTVILALTALVALEKLTPIGLHVARVSGVLFLGMAVWMMLR